MFSSNHRLLMKNDHHPFLADMALKMAEDKESIDGGESSSAPKRKRTRTKRKVEEAAPGTPEVAAKKAAPAPTIVLKPRDDSPVQMQVMSVRDMVSGGSPKSTITSNNSSPTKIAVAASSTATGSSSRNDSTSTPSSPTSYGGSSSSSMDDSLQQLLEDAKMMQLENDDVEEESGSGTKATIRNALSTLVTADFFLVCAFLLWFLAGIFCSSVLKDDTVQIAFNSNFQAFVQPALGVLMIGSIAGGFLQDEEEEAGGGM